MSFDLFLHRFQESDTVPANRDAVLGVLRRYSDANADKYGFYVVEFQDGSRVEFPAKGLESEEEFSGCAFHLRRRVRAKARIPFRNYRAMAMFAIVRSSR